MLRNAKIEIRDDFKLRNASKIFLPPVTIAEKWNGVVSPFTKCNLVICSYIPEIKKGMQ